jgi:hypothetical protein
MPKRPTTYDEITRRTVIEPDTSFRPSRDEVHRAYRGYRALDPVEQQLDARIRVVLAAMGPDAAHVKIEIDGDTVALYGTVVNQDTLARVAEAVRAVEGAKTVIDELVIG